MAKRAGAVCVVAIALAVGPRAASARQTGPSSTFTVGTATAQRGSTATGAIVVPAGSDSGLAISVAVIHGARPGPVVALIAGSHGTEYSTIIAMQRLVPRIDPAQLSGTVIIVPVMNIPSFTSMTPQRNPVDDKTMVGGYPGDSLGTQSQRAMWYLTSQVIAQSNVVVDFHGGDLDEDVGLPFITAVRGGRAKPDSESVRLALAFGLDHVQVSDRNAEAPTAGRSLIGQALIRGEAVMLVAAGRSGVVADADLATIINGSLNLLGALRMIDRPAPPVPHPIWLASTGPRITAQGSGVFFATVAPNTMIKKAQAIGYTTDFLGKKTGDILSPVDGLVMYVHGVPSMQRGVVLAEVIPVVPSVTEWHAR